MASIWRRRLAGALASNQTVGGVLGVWGDQTPDADTKNPARCWRHVDAWRIPTLVVARLRRVRCRRCGVWVEQVPWARPRSRLTHMFEAEILKRARTTSIAGVCRQLGLHWTTLMRLIEHWVHESVNRRFRRKLRAIGVDEVSYGRGQGKYLTIVWDTRCSTDSTSSGT